MLSFENVSFSYPYRLILSSCSWHLNPGQFVHLKGPNGCGKSTLLALAAGLLRPSSGRILSQTLDPRETCAYLSADANGLIAGLDPSSQLQFWAGLRRKITPALAEAALQYWGFGPPLAYRRMPSSAYSTGMRRRLALASLQLSQAPCLLLDEPTSGLDDAGKHLFSSWLGEHKQNGGSLILICHDTDPLPGLIDAQWQWSKAGLSL